MAPGLPPSRTAKIRAAIGSSESYKTFRRIGRRARFLVFNPLRYCADVAAAQVSRAVEFRRPTAPTIRRIALISDDISYCSEQQFYPFDYYRRELRNELGLISTHLLVRDILRAPSLALRPFDIIAIKLSYRTPACDALRVVKAIRQSAPRQRIAYFDGDDDLGIQWPAILPFVDLYVKKHILRDLNGYRVEYAGKSYLHDYVHRVHGHVFTSLDYGPPEAEPMIIHNTTPVPADQLEKIHLGYNIGLDQKILSLRDRITSSHTTKPKQSDIHFRGTISAHTFTRFFREPANAILQRLQSEFRVILPTNRVDETEYYRELLDSKICVSPFGYGEICWRDFEAVLCGSLLVKQEMEHLRTEPDIFVPFITYVPVKWDFSDLEGKCRYYLDNVVEREAIAAEAKRRLLDYYNTRGFEKSISTVLTKLYAPHRSAVDSIPGTTPTELA